MKLSPASRAQSIERRDASGARHLAEDTIVVESPLEIRLGGAPYAVIMRTPGDDRELVCGLLIAEGIIGRGAPPEVRVVADDVVDVAGVAAVAAPRAMVSNSSCGVCGKASIDDLVLDAPVVDADFTMAAAVVASLPERLRAHQAVFDATGGLHAAAAFTAAGELVAVREDVGRHNAVDKLVGWALAAGRLPAHQLALCVSGRLGYEIAQKAVVAGFPVVAAVSAPSSLAVELADRHGVALCGFVRGGSFNVYCQFARVT